MPGIVGRQSQSVAVARAIYSIVAILLVVLALGTVLLAATSTPDGCKLVLSLGAPAALGPASGPQPAPSPGPAGVGLPSLCNQYVDVSLPIILVLLGLALFLAASRLGGEPRAWGPIVALGAVAGIIVAVGTAYAIIGISTSEPQSGSPGLVTILIAVLPVLVALACTAALGRAYRRRADANPT